MIAALRVENLAVSRGERALFSALNLSLGAGQALALTGANGAGKTSLLRAIAGLIRPDAGRVVFEGAGGEIEAETARATQLHMLGHHDGLKGGRTAREELLFQTRWTGGSEQSAMAAAERLEITKLLDLEVRKLSAGQRRRLALARLLASPRSIWLLDEPMAPLDAGQRIRFAGILNDHLALGGLVIAAVHDPLPLPCSELRVGA